MVPALIALVFLGSLLIYTIYLIISYVLTGKDQLSEGWKRFMIRRV